MIKTVVLSGGSGSRLWPLSRTMYPKQFFSLIGEKTLLQDTLLRTKDLEVDEQLIICNEEHRFLVTDQLNSIQEISSIILEPAGRNTAPAVAVAANLSIDQSKNTDPLLLILPADHLITDTKLFCNSVEQAIPLAKEGKLVSFGVAPTSPHTGYGYIKKGDSVSPGLGFKISNFIEKPNLTNAEKYLTSGDYLWNSGIFLFKASIYLEELMKFRPDIASKVRLATTSTIRDADYIKLDRKAFLDCPSDSIDYAVMEKTKKGVVVPLNVGWSDMGSWKSLWEYSDKDPKGNILKGDVLAIDNNNSLIYGDQKLVVSLGLDNLVLIDTKDALLVTTQDRVEEVKNVVDDLKTADRPEIHLHREVSRPWGKYDSVDSGETFQVKRITVNPKAKLSLQMHHHRCEHWIVISGVATVTCEDKIFELKENESTYIPQESTHSLENRTDQPLVLIEVQLGSYLGEDDIVRFEDKYGRINSED